MAPASACPESLEEANGAVAGVTAVVSSHDWLDGLGGLVGVVEGDGGDVVVEDVGLDDAVKQVTTDETELAVNGCGGTTGKGPGGGVIVRQSGIGVLEESDGN